jgi:hypothetical protein
MAWKYLFMEYRIAVKRAYHFSEPFRSIAAHPVKSDSSCPRLISITTAGRFDLPE